MSGRAADPEVLASEPGGPFDVVSASAIKFEGGALPRALTEEDILGYVEDYGVLARNFVEGAGGDGVELHCGNGYLLDAFLQTDSNHREDRYWGSVENRARFPLEVSERVVEAVGAPRVGIRVTPFSTYQGWSFYIDCPQVRIIDFLLLHRNEDASVGPPGDVFVLRDGREDEVPRPRLPPRD